MKLKVFRTGGDGSCVHISLVYLEYIEIFCIFASEVKPYLYAKERENEKQDRHLPCDAPWHPFIGICHPDVSNGGYSYPQIT